MILLFTDFGSADLYVGQVHAALLQHAPGVAIVDLLHDVPNFNVRAGAHLLAALGPRAPEGAVFMAVVDPGVGSAREAVVAEADGRWYVGPDNGLLFPVAARAKAHKVWRIRWRPEGLSASFHGRDLFGPIAAWIAAGPFPEGKLERKKRLAVAVETGDLAEIIYIDHYGNGMTGLRASAVARESVLHVGNESVPFAGIYADAPTDAAFWYENSLGLVEIAVNRGSAARNLGLAVGTRVRLG